MGGQQSNNEMTAQLELFNELLTDVLEYINLYFALSPVSINKTEMLTVRFFCNPLLVTENLWAFSPYISEILHSSKKDAGAGPET